MMICASACSIRSISLSGLSQASSYIFLVMVDVYNKCLGVEDATDV